MVDAYKRSPSPFNIDADTPFVNVLITDGQTSGGSSDVHGALEGMRANGIDTYVIGFGTDGELDRGQLEQYAQWGGTDAAVIVDPAQPGSATALADAMAAIVSGLDLDGCCVLNDCSAQPEPADPRPICGDARIEEGESCDDGELNASVGHCSARCDGPHLVCGDGRIDGPEQCDDGNTASGDGCDTTCLSEPQSHPVGDEPQEDGGIVVPPSLNRPPVQRPPAGAAASGATQNAPSVGTRPVLTGPRARSPLPVPRASGGGGCSLLPNASGSAGAWPVTLLFALLLVLRGRRSASPR